MTITITLEQMEAALTKAVEMRGEDYVYPHGFCTYFDEAGEPSCGVGVALVELGVREQVVAALTRYQEQNGTAYKGLHAGGQPLADSLCLRLKDEGVVVDRRAARLADAFQGKQDAQVPWGEALELAKAGRGRSNPVMVS